MRTDQEFLNSLRQVGDAEADAVVSEVSRMNAIPKLYGYLRQSVADAFANDSLPVVRDFLLGKPELPAWFDSEKLVRGQQFFKRHALEIMGLLGAMALPYCYAASPGNKAIYLTEKMRKVPGVRLVETAHFIIEVMKEGSFHEDGSGVFEVRKTRLVHALVRHYVVTKTSWEPGWGAPINQEDMAGTNLAFSFIIIRGMLLSGYKLSPSDIDDFLFAWRFVGFQLGIESELLPENLEDAEKLEEAIRLRHFRKSSEAPLLTADLLRHYKESFPPPASWLVESQVRYFVGPEVSQLLNIQEHPVKDSVVNTINRVRQFFNRNFTNPLSYRIMIKNHYKLKEKYTRHSN